VRINFWIGVAFVVSGVLSLLVEESNDLPVAVTYLGIALGLLFAAALPVSRTRPYSVNGLLAVQGIALCLLVVAYCWFMWYVTYRWIPASAANQPYRVKHAPGILALAGGYGIRLAYDFGARNRVERLARRLGFVGIIVGGMGDLLVLYFMISSFPGFPPKGF